ncbi:B12-binding domain-containing radical SAM protein [Thermodesulfobacteriota bacterium]
MKILLIQSAFLYRHHTHLQPLGIMYVASALRQEGHDVHILDMKVERIDASGAMRVMDDLRPDVIGLTAMTYESTCMFEVAEKARQRFPDVPVVVGGAHASNLPERTLRACPGIDYVCIGEGEITFVELLETLQAGGDVSTVRGLAYRMNGRLSRTDPRPFIEDVDTIPSPAWDLIPVEKYFTIPRGGIIFWHREFMTLFSSRSCPYQCIYCHRNLGKRYRPRSPERVVEEIEILVHDFGIREIEFMDDMFNLDKERVKVICNLILERGLRIKLTFPNGLRADLLDVATLRALKEAGMYRCMLAIETGSPRLQKFIKKNVNLEKARNMIDQAVKMGIMTHGAFMLGFPTETEEEMRMTIDYARGSRFHTAAFYRVLPFPGSELYEMVQRERPDLEIDPARFEYHSTDVNLSAVDEGRVTQLRKKAYRTFYFNPLRLLRIFYRLPNKLVLIPHLARMFVHRALER